MCLSKYTVSNTFVVSTLRTSNLLYEVVSNSKYDTSTQLGSVHGEQTETTVL